jgi:hypothetical protein
VIAALIALGIAVQLNAGRIRLYMAPKAWQEVSKTEDPGRFWLFVAVEIILMVGAVAMAISR